MAHLKDAPPYGLKTLIGNWTEGRLGPDFGGLKPAAETENQIRALETSKRIIPSHGAHILATHTRRVIEEESPAAASPSSPSATSAAVPTLPSVSSGLRFATTADRYDYGNIIQPDRLFPAGTWSSVTASGHFGHTGGGSVDPYEFNSRYSLVESEMTRDATKLAAYQSRWINDEAGATRRARFTSEMGRALSSAVPEGFASLPDRVLPATCKSLEAVRDLAIERHGSNSIWLILKALPPTLTLPQFRKALAGLGIPLTIDRGKEIWRFFDPREEGVCSRRVIQNAFLGLSGSNGGGGGGGGDSISAATFSNTAASSTTLRGQLDSTTAITSSLLPRRRMDALDTVWALLTRIQAGMSRGGGTAATSSDSIPLLTLLNQFDPSPENHPDVKTRVIPSPEDAKVLLRQCCMYILQGEPAAAPIVVLAREAGGGGGHVDGAHTSSRSPSGTSTAGLSASLALTREQFNRANALISAGVDSDAIFVQTLIGCWHLADAAFTLSTPEPGQEGGGFSVPETMKPALEAAARVSRGIAASPALFLAAAASDAVTSKSGRLDATLSQSLTATALAGSRAGVARGGATKDDSAAATAAFGRDLTFTHLALLVTHTNGRKSLQKIPTDRFLRKDDPADLKARLAAIGVHDVASISQDF